MNIEELIQKDEGVKLDFKRDYELGKEKSEYLKDIIALANGSINTIGETAYLIFGIKEIEGAKNEIYGVNIEKNSQTIQQHFINRLNSCLTKPIQELNVKEFELESKKVIVVEIPFQGYLLILKENLKGTQYKKGNFLYRVGEQTQFVEDSYDCSVRKNFEEALKGYHKADKIRPSNKKFEPKREINEEDGTYINEKNKVSLFASLPVLNDYESRLSIECEITFILENSTKIMVTVSEEEVLKSLFSGYRFKTYKRNNKRGWIVFFDKNSNLYTIQISSSSINISLETVDILSEILDDLQKVYASKMNSLEDKLNSRSFPFSSEYKNGFELCKIDQRLWKDIQKFVSKHNRIDNITEAWNIFGDSLYKIDVYNKEEKVNMMFTYRIDTNIDFNRNIANSKIVIVWDTISTHHSLKHDIIMSVEESYTWFISKFIPQVIKETYQDEQIENSSKLFFKKVSNPKFKDNSYSNINNFKADEEDSSLLAVSENLANFFYGKEVAITENTLKDLYEGLILLFEKSEKLDYGYLYRKLSLVGNKQRIALKKFQLNSAGKKDFIEYIQEELKEIEKGEMSIDDLVSRHTIDHLLRCYNSTIRDNIDLYGDSFRYDISQKLKGIKEIYDVVKICERRLRRY